MATHEEIYRNQAEAYEWMISKQPDFINYINEIRPVPGLDILDLGAGSGRFAVSLAKQAKSLLCTDKSDAMLSLLDRKLEQQGVDRNWTTLVADHRQLPLADGSVDMVISGWSLCYLAHSGMKNWENNLEQMLVWHSEKMWKRFIQMLFQQFIGKHHDWQQG